MLGGSSHLLGASENRRAVSLPHGSLMKAKSYLYNTAKQNLWWHSVLHRTFSYNEGSVDEKYHSLTKSSKYHNIKSTINLEALTYSWLCPSVLKAVCVFVVTSSSAAALTHGLGDAVFWVLDDSVSGWHESANLSRAFSQFFWDLVLFTVRLSRDMAAPAPSPDWDFLIFSWIWGGKKKRHIESFCCSIQRFSQTGSPHDVLPGLSFQFPLYPVPLLSSSPSSPTFFFLYSLHWSPFEKTIHVMITTSSSMFSHLRGANQKTYSWTEAGASSRWKTPSLPTVCRRDSARSLYLGFLSVLPSSYSLLCTERSTNVISGRLNA